MRLKAWKWKAKETESWCLHLRRCLPVHQFQKWPFILTSHVVTFPAFLPYVMPTPRGCASFPAIREGFVATPLCLPSLLSAAFPFVLSILSQLSKSHLLGMLALLPSVSVGPTFCVPFCFEWSSWSYSAALLQLFCFFFKKRGEKRDSYCH